MKNNEIELNKAKQLHLSNKINEAQNIYLKLIKSDNSCEPPELDKIIKISFFL